MKYYGGINFEKWINRVMSANSSEVAGISKEFKTLLERQRATEQADELTNKIRGEKSVHPRVVIESDY